MMLRVSLSMDLRAASTSWTTMSASVAPCQAAATMARSSRFFGAKIPGVSTNTIWLSPSVAMPSTRVRVVCTRGDTIEILAPIMVFSSVDLPALGAPTKATKPQRGFSGSGAGTASGCVAVKGGRVSSLIDLCSNAAQHFHRRGFLRRPFRSPLPDRRLLPLEVEFDLEDGAVVRAGLSQGFVYRQGQAPALRPFLQRG